MKCKKGNRLKGEERRGISEKLDYPPGLRRKSFPWQFGFEQGDRIHHVAILNVTL